MPRGQYGNAARAQITAPDADPAADAPAAVVVAGHADYTGSGSGWGAAVVAAIAVTGVVTLGALTTSFTGQRRRRSVRSPFRSLT